MKKLQTTISILAVAAISMSFYFNAAAKSQIASAHHDNGDSCNETFTYEKSYDFNDNRVNIDFINTQSAGNPDSVNVTADSGYQLVSVYLDVDNDNHNGYVNYTTHFPGTYNPTGEDINEAKVIVKKVCATATPTPTTRPSITPTVTPTATPTPSVTVTPSATPTPTQCGEGTQYNANLNICIQCDGDATCEVQVGDVSPTPTVDPTATPTPTAGQSDNNSNSSSSSSAPESLNAGISATNYADTGVFSENLSNILLAFGALLTFISLALYGKEQKAIQK